MSKITVVSMAHDMAQDRHGDQIRKFNGEPYFNHPLRVVQLIGMYTKDEHIIAAGYLHDLVENHKKTTHSEINDIFGNRISGLVFEVTSDKEKQTKIGKPEYLLSKMLKMTDDALLIKLCDRLDNISDYIGAPESFVRRYTNETTFIINNLKRNKTSAHHNLIVKIKQKILYGNENF